jgi:hypothetical protein
MIWFSDMLYVIRPDFEVVKEGWVLYRFKHLQTQIEGVFYLVPVWCQDLDEYGMF